MQWGSLMSADTSWGDLGGIYTIDQGGYESNSHWLARKEIKTYWSDAESQETSAPKAIKKEDTTMGIWEKTLPEREKELSE